MTRKITIDPVSRIEGHGKVTIYLDDQGNVVDARFQVQELRGFEKFCEGRMLWEMPVITSRICGICPVSHHLAAVKAVENLLGMEIPTAAVKLRELMHTAQFIQNHALHFFYLAAPDLLMGPDANPRDRNVFGLLDQDPQLAQKAIRLRQIGQNIIERVGGRSIHPVTAIPGGMSKPLSHEDRFLSMKEIDEALSLSLEAMAICRELFLDRHDPEFPWGGLESKYLALVGERGLELFEGNIQVMNSDGTICREFSGNEYLNHIGEDVAPDSYLKFPHLIEDDGGKSTYRVGPLARMNVAGSIKTPLAGNEMKEFKQLGQSSVVNDTMYYHYARIIELLYAVENAREILCDDMLVHKETRIPAVRQAGEGVGVIEAPRGTLIHHYWADELGKITKVNIIVPTTHNNGAINESVKQVASKLIRAGEVEEGILNRVEMVIRCYDPCLSCSTHQIGKMPLLLELRSSAGRLLKCIRRDVR